ncbi:MAG: hypothetical protein HY22_06310 [[Candidatus Thermochlorobacteriaceae] bacterium GBChlB]|nr:MAG: hypothetical protein HY22_06310 [[Candidatus Thermochlorobacteriaceae] bacterium GBChlB]
MLQSSTLKFLKDLKKHNDKAWFEANRARYDDARADFHNFVQHLINGISAVDESIAAANLQVKNCTFRINRDVRFSKDKSPYKTNLACAISSNGKDMSENAGFYFHVEPGASFAAGGLYMPMSSTLARIRKDISDNFDEWQDIVESRAFRKNFPNGMRDENALSRPPKGYTGDNPAIAYLKMKSFIAETAFTDEDLQAKTLVKQAVKAFQAMKPLIDFLNYKPD